MGLREGPVPGPWGRTVLRTCKGQQGGAELDVGGEGGHGLGQVEQPVVAETPWNGREGFGPRGDLAVA